MRSPSNEAAEFSERPQGNRPAVSVIVPARDAAGTLRLTLDGLALQRVDAAFEVIVIDNGSNDDTPSVAERHPSAPRVIRRERGGGPGVARNDGVAASRAPILAFIDADCVPTDMWLVEGIKALTVADIVVGAVSPRPDVPIGPYDRSLWVTCETGLYETANMFVRRNWFERVEGFQDWLPDLPGLRGAAGRPFGEDSWFAWRARRLGARTMFGSLAVVHHAVFPRRAREYVRDQLRLRYFPALVARMPELRDVFAWIRWFLNARSAAFDLALAGAVAAIVLRSAIPLAAAAPYVVSVSRYLRVWRPRGAAVAHMVLVSLVRDALGCAALLLGSIQASSYR